jgi:hypothetical protein
MSANGQSWRSVRSFFGQNYHRRSGFSRKNDADRLKLFAPLRIFSAPPDAILNLRNSTFVKIGGDHAGDDRE